MTLTHRFVRAYAVLTTLLVHTAALGHYLYLNHTCTGWDCLGVSIYGRTLLLGVAGIAVLAAGAIALDSVLRQHYRRA